VITPWITLPLALAAMLAVSAHVTATQHSSAPASRRRIRVCNGWVMLITIPLIAAGVSLLTHDRDPRLFTLTWAAVVLLLLLTITLAAADVLNTVRIARAERRQHLVELAKRAALNRQQDPADHRHGHTTPQASSESSAP